MQRAWVESPFYCIRKHLNPTLSPFHWTRMTKRKQVDLVSKQALDQEEEDSESKDDDMMLEPFS